MGNKNLKTVLWIASAVIIILFTGASGKLAASAKTSDFTIKDGVLIQYLGLEKEIVIPEDVKTIGVGAFENCTSLQEVMIPDGINTISDNAFRNCTGLEMIDLPESISYIGGGCFENCTSLETILFPTQEFFIGRNAFNNTQWMNNQEGDYVTINHTLIRYRGNEANITIPDYIMVIGDAAFENCTFITSVNIPICVKEIGNSAFYGCSALTEIIVPDNVKRVGSTAFSDCSNLEKITIPKNVDINRNSLENTKWMADYQGDFIILNGNLLGYQGTSAIVVIPDNVTAICTGAFADNSIVTEVIIPKSVVKLYYAGFINCNNLQKIFITNKNINIEYKAFFDCRDLKLYCAVGGAAEVYARENHVPFVSYGLNKIKAIIYLGGDDTTSLKVMGIDGIVQWKSEDETIAKVSESGVVTAVKTGNAKINAIVNGITMTCEITVKNPYISKSSLTIMVGKTSRLNIIGISSGITWLSGKKSVASVSSKGVITANKAGTATITAIFNGIKYTCKVTVK